MRLVEKVANLTDACTVLVELDGKTAFRRPRSRQQDNIIL
jgi:hypothetical protein